MAKSKQEDKIELNLCDKIYRILIEKQTYVTFKFILDEMNKDGHAEYFVQKELDNLVGIGKIKYDFPTHSYILSENFVR